jgi:hypothetical protein
MSSDQYDELRSEDQMSNYNELMFEDPVRNMMNSGLKIK